MRQIAAGQIEAHRLGAGRDQERCRSRDALPSSSWRWRLRAVDRRDAGAEMQLDAVLAVEFRRAQRDPLLGSIAGQIVLRQIWPVVGHGGVGAEHDDAAGIALAAQRLGGAVAGRAAAQDDDRSRWPAAGGGAATGAGSRFSRT